MRYNRWLDEEYPAGYSDEVEEDVEHESTYTHMFRVFSARDKAFTDYLLRVVVLATGLDPRDVESNDAVRVAYRCAQREIPQHEAVAIVRALCPTLATAQYARLKLAAMEYGYALNVAER